MRKKPDSKKRKVEFGEDLIKALMHSFVAAYHLHVAHGESVEAILIRHDIVAASMDTHPVILQAHQAAIRSAVEAADKHIPLPLARVELESRMRLKLLRFAKDLR